MHSLCANVRPLTLVDLAAPAALCDACYALRAVRCVLCAACCVWRAACFAHHLFAWGHRWRAVQQWHLEGVACLTRDMLCLLALRLTGQFADIARAGSHGVSLLSALLRNLDDHHEIDWLDFILQEVLQVRRRRHRSHRPALQS